MQRCQSLWPCVLDNRMWEDRAKKDSILGTHRNDTNNLVFSIIYWVIRTKDKSKNVKKVDLLIIAIFNSLCLYLWNQHWCVVVLAYFLIEVITKIIKIIIKIIYFLFVFIINIYIL